MDTGGHVFAINTAAGVLRNSSRAMQNAYAQYTKWCGDLEIVFHDVMHALTHFPRDALREEQPNEVIEV